MIGENNMFGRVSETEKVANHCERSLASDEVCSEKTGVNAKKQVPKST